MDKTMEDKAVRPGVLADGNTTLKHDDEEVNSLDLLTIIVRKKFYIVGIPLLAGIIAGGLSLLMPNIYTGTASVLPPQQSQSGSSAILGQLGALGGMSGSALGLKNPSDLYIGMLNSRTVADRIIERFKLQSVYGTKTLTDTRLTLSSSSTIGSGKEGIIAIDVKDKDPKRAAALANGYVEELQRLTQTLAITEASRRRLFFEKQLMQSKQLLADAEVSLKVMQEKSGLIQLNGQAEALIKSSADLRAQIASKEVALSAMQTFATGSNPEYMRARQELVGLREQLKKMESGLNQGSGDLLVGSGRIPEAGLEYVRRVRDVKYAETIFELMSKQFEIAKLDEAKDSSIIQALDVAIVPDKKSKPNRGVIVVSTILFVGILTMFWILASEFLRKMKQNPAQLRRLRKLSDSLKSS
ncbi:Wzz/FepE/Etk N-terminal domain-containing protein [Janthinobacterium sp. UMAB-60]|uniref:GumC family protein n=1 Tax=Janthinobacterium sp. UMAB-60 TaxID=1365365 RepID=UPI001C563F91|nr:Wzz/FepE/Etk N-terminal domain-containing protein [Janthinobacterium sp. UMAB-60]